jgi:uncharacterized protein (TIGR02117 family)
MSGRWRKIISLSVLGFATFATSYGAAGMVGGALPTNNGWRAPETGVRIFVESNGIHTGLVMPVVAEGLDWRDLAQAGDIADPRFAAHPYVAIGWGERAFYLQTRTWADVKVQTILGAAIGSDRTLMHVEHVAMPRPGPDVREIMLRPEEYRKLAAFVRASFRVENGRTTHQFGYASYDAFYDAHGKYSAIATCNAWTGDALRHAGVRIGGWTPFPVNVLGWFAQ